MSKETLSVRETAEILGLAESTVYQQAREGGLPTINIGGRTLFPGTAIKHLARYGHLPASDAGDVAREQRRANLLDRKEILNAEIQMVERKLAELDAA